MKFIIVLIISIIIFTSVSISTAHNNAVIIPLNSAKKLNNVVTVSKRGGNFTDPVAAVQSITDASYENQYLIIIGPGVYTITDPLIPKSFVSITGAGQGVTRLTGARNGSIVEGNACHYTLSNLTIENTGGGQSSSAVSNHCYAVDSSPILENLTLMASGGDTNTGIRNSGYADRPGAWIPAVPLIKNVTTSASGGTNSYGVHNYHASPILLNVTPSATNATNNYGIYNYYSLGQTFIKNCTIKGDLATLGLMSIEDSNISGNVTIDMENVYVRNASISGDITGGPGYIHIFRSSVHSVSTAHKTCKFSDNFINELDNNCVEITP